MKLLPKKRANPEKINKQLLAESLSKSWKNRRPSAERRHVTPLQIYVALHELAIRLCEPFTFDQIIHQMNLSFNIWQISPSILPSIIRREVKEILFEGIAFGWYRCSNGYRFKASVVPPPKIQLDHRLKIKFPASPASRIPFRDDMRLVPRNVVLHGEVWDENEVPGFLVTAEDFMAFIERVGPWKSYSSPANRAYY